MSHHLDSIPIQEFIDIVDKLDAGKYHELAGTSRTQFNNWRKKHRIPTKNFWAFQNRLSVFFIKEMVRKMVILGVIDKEFLRNLLEECDKE